MIIVKMQMLLKLLLRHLEKQSQVHRKLHTFRGDAKLSTWIARIARNRCLNLLARKPVETEPINETDAVLTTNPGAELDRSSRVALVHRQLERLAPNDRLVLTLYHLHDFSVAEIAAVLEKPTGTVKSDLYRARRRLHAHLTPFTEQLT